MAAEAPHGSDIKVVPSALGEASGLARTASEAIRGGSRAMASGALAAIVGDPGCADALERATRLLEETLRLAADGVGQLATALASASGTYRLADDVAVAGTGG